MDGEDILVTAILAAAGKGKRMGLEKNKLFIPLLNLPVLAHSVLAVANCSDIDNLIIVASTEDISRIRDMLLKLPITQLWQVVEGGSERQYSIANALRAVPPATEIILVHDGARPLIDPGMVGRVIAAACACRAAGVAVPVKDTIKTVDTDGFATGTPDRRTLWAIQTPQAFEASLLRQAYAKAAADGFLGTDDASLVERLGVRVKLVEGHYSNLKITTPEDMLFAAALLKAGSEAPEKDVK